MTILVVEKPETNVSKTENGLDDNDIVINIVPTKPTVIGKFVKADFFMIF